MHSKYMIIKCTIFQQLAWSPTFLRIPALLYLHRASWTQDLQSCCCCNGLNSNMIQPLKTNILSINFCYGWIKCTVLYTTRNVDVEFSTYQSFKVSSTDNVGSDMPRGMHPLSSRQLFLHWGKNRRNTNVTTEKSFALGYLPKRNNRELSIP